jgi:hypothetical protein
MSFSFHFTPTGRPESERVLGQLAVPSLRCVDGMPVGPWPQGLRHFHLDRVSTRCVEAGLDGDRFHVRILSLSSLEDYDLALRLVEALAGHGTAVTPESGEPFTVVGGLAAASAPWAAEHLAGCAESICLLAQQDHEFNLHGPVRPFYLGSRLSSELLRPGARDALAERLVGMMRKVQYADDCYCARTIVGTTGSGEEMTIAVWGAGQRYLFPLVDVLAVEEGESFFLVPYDALPLIAGDRCVLLDEHQALVEKTPDEQWSDMAKRARGFELSPLSFGRLLRRPQEPQGTVVFHCSNS